jgi:hypothetical protein
MTQKLDMSCPKCGSDQTQKITSLVAGGTSNTVAHTSTVGVGTVGSSVAVYSSGGTTRGSQQTELAKRFVQPRKKVVAPVLGFLIDFVVWGWIPAALVYAFGSGFFSAVTFMATLVMVWRWSKKRADRNTHYNVNVYPNEAATWDHGFFCHRCDTVYIPE